MGAEPGQEEAAHVAVVVLPIHLRDVAVPVGPHEGVELLPNGVHGSLGLGQVIGLGFGVSPLRALARRRRYTKLPYIYRAKMCKETLNFIIYIK